MKTKKKSAKAKRRDRHVSVYGPHCYLCGDAMVHPDCLGLGVGRGRLRATFDHVWPKSRGGKSGHNTRLAHAICNTDKGDWTYTELLLGFRLN